MDMQAVRRANLRALIEQWGGLRALARKLGYLQAPFLSQMNSGNRAITEKTARRIESTLKLPPGWMDGQRAIAAGPAGASGH